MNVWLVLRCVTRCASTGSCACGPTSGSLAIFLLSVSSQREALLFQQVLSAAVTHPASMITLPSRRDVGAASTFALQMTCAHVPASRISPYIGKTTMCGACWDRACHLLSHPPWCRTLCCALVVTLRLLRSTQSAIDGLRGLESRRMLVLRIMRMVLRCPTCTHIESSDAKLTADALTRDPRRFLPLPLRAKSAMSA